MNALNVDRVLVKLGEKGLLMPADIFELKSAQKGVRSDFASEKDDGYPDLVSSSLRPFGKSYSADAATADDDLQIKSKSVEETDSFFPPLSSGLEDILKKCSDDKRDIFSSKSVIFSSKADLCDYFLMRFEYLLLRTIVGITRNFRREFSEVFEQGKSGISFGDVGYFRDYAKTVVDYVKSADERSRTLLKALSNTECAKVYFSNKTIHDISNAVQTSSDGNTVSLDSGAAYMCQFLDVQSKAEFFVRNSVHFYEHELLPQVLEKTRETAKKEYLVLMSVLNGFLVFADTKRPNFIKTDVSHYFDSSVQEMKQNLSYLENADITTPVLNVSRMEDALLAYEVAGKGYTNRELFRTAISKHGQIFPYDGISFLKSFDSRFDPKTGLSQYTFKFRTKDGCARVVADRI